LYYALQKSCGAFFTFFASYIQTRRHTFTKGGGERPSLYMLFIFDTQTLEAFKSPFDINISKTKTGLTRILYTTEN